jgi:hypothetical protein
VREFGEGGRRDEDGRDNRVQEKEKIYGEGQFIT